MLKIKSGLEAVFFPNFVTACLCADAITFQLQALCDYLIYHEHNPRIALELSALATVHVGPLHSIHSF